MNDQLVTMVGQVLRESSESIATGATEIAMAMRI